MVFPEPEELSPSPLLRLRYVCEELDPELIYVGDRRIPKPYVYRCVNCGQVMEGVYPSEVIMTISHHFGVSESQARHAYVHSVHSTREP